MEQNIFKKFSDNIKKVLIEAEKIARDQKTNLNTEHQLLSLSLIKDGLASELLVNYGITPDKIGLTSSLMIRSLESDQKLGITSDAKKSIEKAVKIASEYGHTIVDCEHLLLAILSNQNYNSYKIISRIGIKPEIIQTQIRSIFGSLKEVNIPKNDNISSDQYEEDFDPIEMIRPVSPLNPTLNKTKKESLLELFSKNITSLAREDKLDPVIGREAEMERVMQILSRRTKNNPILVGEPGVGKTSVVEGLAQRIIIGKVPINLLGHEILSLDMASLIAGTMYRGQFESRIKKILSEIKKKRNIILFIDEIHTVVGAGSTEGSVDAANILKPMLTRGELRLVGSTTFDEYKKYIEKDSAFERRLQPVKILEPNIDETIKILHGIKNKYEKHHQVKYTDKAISAAAILSRRYINDRFLPDKAIDLIDEAAAATRTFSKNAVRLTKLKKQLREILHQKDDLIVEEHYKEATLLREKEIRLEQEIEKLKNNDDGIKMTVIDDTHIAKLVAKWTGVPVTNLTFEEKKRYLNLESRIKKRVVGQDEAIQEISKAIKRARVGISNPNRPLGSFIFLGPTGVGKSLLAKVMAEEVLGDKKSLIKIDMSEFMERHNVSRLIGAPAGYIGYEEGGKLTEAIRKNPYSVVLLDEIEKAHPEVFNILLQVMEDGELTDARGRRIDFKNTIIIMTSNLGTDVLTHQAAIGFKGSMNLKNNYEKLEKSVLESVEKNFRPEFINRIDKIIIFKPLSDSSIQKITNIELAQLKTRLLSNNYNISFSDSIKKYISKKGYDPDFGARPIRKAIADFIEAPLSEKILTEEFLLGDNIYATEKNDAVVLSKIKNKKSL